VKFSGLIDRVSASASRQMLSSPTPNPFHAPSPVTIEVYSRWAARIISATHRVKKRPTRCYW
jgi:hypothetical protein